MSMNEILQALPQLTTEERQALRLRLAELDGEVWLDEGALTDAEKALIEERCRTLQAHPETAVTWTEAKERLLAPYRR